jgi:hypothetical protein
MRVTLFITAAILAALAPAARAGERVTLRVGTEILCDRSVKVEEGRRIRLYLSAGDDNYQEFKAEEITQIETVPDEPISPQPTPSEKPSAASPEARTDANSDDRLTPGDLHEMLAKASQEYNLDVDLLASLVKAESGGHAHAVSSAGAQGLMQLMPGTATEMGVNDRFEPKQNVHGGTAYLNKLLIYYKENLVKALAAYNAGPEAVDKYHGIPPYHETQVYVARVIHEFNRLVLAREAEAKRLAALAKTSQN